jgi:hypothetical protein
MLAAAIAAVFLFAMAGIVGWADYCHQRRVTRMQRQLAAPVIAKER